MEKCLENENACDIFMNEVKGPLKEPKENASVQTKGSENPKKKKKKSNKN
jgi:hypothetical protein